MVDEPVPQIDVPPGAEPAGRCPYCDRPLPTERLLALHVGEAHPDRAGPAELEAAAAAAEAESDELFVFHLKVVIALVVLFMGIGYTYAFALS